MILKKKQQLSAAILMSGCQVQTGRANMYEVKLLLETPKATPGFLFQDSAFLHEQQHTAHLSVRATPPATLASFLLGKSALTYFIGMG